MPSLVHGSRSVPHSWPCPVACLQTQHPMVKHVYIIRHGERVDHVDRNWAATAKYPADPPLTDRGHKQASEVGSFLASLPPQDRPTLLLASPFYRTLQTAAGISTKLDLPIRPEFGAMEWLNRVWFGDFADFPAALLRPTAETYPTLGASVDAGYASIHTPGGKPETRQEIFARCYETAAVIKEKIADDVVAIVGHGISVEALARGFAGDDAPVQHVTYCSITDCVADEAGSWSLGKHNCDASHLTEPEHVSHVHYD